MGSGSWFNRGMAIHTLQSETTDYGRTVVLVEITEKNHDPHQSWEFSCDWCGYMESGLSEHEARYAAHICQRELCPMECGAPVILSGMLVRNLDGTPHDCDA